MFNLSATEASVKLWLWHHPSRTISYLVAGWLHWTPFTLPEGSNLSLPRLSHIYPSCPQELGQHPYQRAWRLSYWHRFSQNIASKERTHKAVKRYRCRHWLRNPLVPSHTAPLGSCQCDTVWKYLLKMHIECEFEDDTLNGIVSFRTGHIPQIGDDFKVLGL